jgi:hypothetical protein
MLDQTITVLEKNVNILSLQIELKCSKEFIFCKGDQMEINVP